MYLRTVRLFMLLFLAGSAYAANFTPLEWQQPVRQHSYSAVMGQRKHTTWVRDQNRNFIDDEIDTRFGPGEAVDIVVDLNQCLTPAQIHETFGRYGRITYVSRTISFFLLSGVKKSDLDAIAARPDVAMIEWQTPLQYMNDVSSRAVQSRNSNTYAATAQAAGFNGNGITIAIMDSGVDDTHEQFAGKFVGGFNAPNFVDANGNGIDDSCEGMPWGNGSCADADDEPANGTINPVPSIGHGTHVAGIALGGGFAGRVCSAPDDGSAPTNCAGVAPGARLLDVMVGAFAPNFASVPGAIDFIIAQRTTFNIHAANLSFGDCTANDGTSAISQQVNYAAAMGIVMVVAAGNAPNCGVPAGTQMVGSPPSASFALTVAGTNDQDTVSRANDINYSGFMRGPRIDFNVMTPNLLALKPDISAPGENINSAQAFNSTGYVSMSGTSMAAPQVAGAAAVMRQALPAIDPGSLKHLLKTRADTSLNVAAFPAVDPVWDNDLGAGMLNLGNAITAAQADVRFPSCVAGSTLPGQACTLTGGQPPWANIFDISTSSSPQVGVPTTITAQVRNDGAVAIPVLVNVGVYVFAAGNNQFFHIGTVAITLAPGTTAVNMPWTPAASNHQCVQVNIDYGLDTNFTNNVTQRNLTVAPSVYEVRIENPFFVPARIEIEARSKRDNWKCDAGTRGFTMDPAECPRNLRVAFHAPRGAKEGDSADCEVAVFATPAGGRRQLIGGVTVRTYVPKPCRIVGFLRDRDGKPVSGAKIVFEPVKDPDRTFEVPPMTAGSDEEGLFDARMTPDVAYTVLLSSEQRQEKPIVVRPRCRQPLHLMLTREGLTEITYVPLEPQTPRFETKK